MVMLLLRLRHQRLTLYILFVFYIVLRIRPSIVLFTIHPLAARVFYKSSISMEV